MTEIYVSTVVESAWGNSHSINLEETSVLDKAGGLDLLTKEALHICVDKCINKDGRRKFWSGSTPTAIKCVLVDLCGNAS